MIDEITRVLNGKSDNVELKAEKIELNKVLDLIKESAKIGGKILSLEMDILSFASDIKKESEKYDEYISKMGKLEASAKELGVTELESEAKSVINEYKQSKKRAESMFSAVTSAIKR